MESSLLKDLLTVAEAAKRLGRCRLTIYRWCQTGQLRYCRLGGRIYLKQKDLERAIKYHTQAA